MPFLVYVVALLITAASVAIGVDVLSGPGVHQPIRIADKQTTAAVRQVPIGKTDDAAVGDPNNALSPIYPARPGKDVPVPDVKIAEPAAASPAAPATALKNTIVPKANAETTGSVPRDTGTVAAQPAVAPVASAPAVNGPRQAAGGSCAIDACASAYRSFRASDCTYQPLSGARKFCDMTQGGAGQATAPQAVDPAGDSRRARAPRTQPQYSDGRGGEPDDVVNTVRRLPGPAAQDDDDDDDGRIVVIQRPQGGGSYSLRRNWMYEER